MTNRTYGYVANETEEYRPIYTAQEKLEYILDYSYWGDSGMLVLGDVIADISECPHRPREKEDILELAMFQDIGYWAKKKALKQPS